MTGRELIIYILTNNLEDEPIFSDGSFIGFISVGKAAEKMGVGTATIYAWISQGRLTGVTIGGETYVPADSKVLRQERSDDIG